MLLTALGGAVMLGAPALTAANGLSASGAGDGVAAVSGYTVSAIDYTLGADPATLDAVSIAVAPIPPGTAEIRVGLDGSFYACALDGGTATCDVSGDPPALAALGDLRIVAAD